MGEGAVRGNMAGRPAVGLVSGLTVTLFRCAAMAIQRLGAMNSPSTSENHLIAPSHLTGTRSVVREDIAILPEVSSFDAIPKSQNRLSCVSAPCWTIVPEN